MPLRRTAAVASLVIGISAAVLITWAARAQSTPLPPATVSSPRDYPVQPVPFTAVHLDDAFWAPRIETNRVETIPFAFKQCELSGRVDNFVRAAKALRGEPLGNTKPPGYPFDDTDRLQGDRGSVLRAERPPGSEARRVCRLADREDRGRPGEGRLSLHDAHHQSRRARIRGPVKQRWELEKDDSHELYNLGHLYEAAVAHYQATGKRTLLDVAIRTADLLVETFGPGKKSIWPGHQITEMGLAKLYRVTGNERYLALAKFLLDERGPNPGEKTNPRGLDYNQSHKRWSTRPRPSGTPCAPPTCIRAWPTWRR